MRNATSSRLGTVLLLAGASWPFLQLVGLWPTSRDAALWIVRGTSSDWASWVFATRHFNVGYRPLTALSYTIDHAIGGFAAPVYRITDLALHLICVVLVSVAYRRLAPHCAPWGALVAAGLYAAHPLVEEVVPHLARRSYSLATALSLSAIVVLAGPVGRAGLGPGRAALTGLLLAAALASNEVVFVTIPVALLLLASREFGRSSPRRIVLTGAALLVPVAAVLAVRTVLVGGVGGYTAQADRLERVAPIVASTWRALVGEVGPLDGGVWAVVGGSIAAAVAGYYAWRAGIEPLRAEGASQRVELLLLVWLGAFALAFAPLGVWFPRQVYPALAPFSLLVAVVLANTLRPSDGRPRSPWHLLPQAVLLGSLVAHSPVFTGPPAQRAITWKGTDGLLRDLVRSGSGIDDGSVLYLVVPHFRRPEVHALRARERGKTPPLGSRLPELWLEALGDGTVDVRTLAVFDEAGPGSGLSPPRVVFDAGVPAIRFESARRVWTMSTEVRVASDASGVWLRADRAIVDAARPASLYVHDGAAGRVEAVGR